jgi:hypothetical protein
MYSTGEVRHAYDFGIPKFTKSNRGLLRGDFKIHQ